MHTSTCVMDPPIYLVKCCQGIILLGLEIYHLESSLTWITQWHQYNLNAWQSWLCLSILLLLPIWSLLGILLVALGLLMPVCFSEVSCLSRATITSIARFTVAGMTPMKIPFALFAFFGLNPVGFPEISAFSMECTITFNRRAINHLHIPAPFVHSGWVIVSQTYLYIAYQHWKYQPCMQSLLVVACHEHAWFLIKLCDFAFVITPIMSL